MSGSLTLLPFAQVPGEMLMDARLKPTHIRVLIALYMHKNKKREEVWPKRKTLSLLTGIHEATISRLTTELEKFGWLTKQGNSGGCGRPAAYRVHVPDHLTSKFDTTVNEDGDIVLPETIAESATVADSTTVADLTKNPSGIDYLTVAESARGKEQTKNRQEQTISGQAVASPPAKPVKPSGKDKAKADTETELQAACRATWAAYSTAYEQRYGAKPVRNASVSAKVKQFVQRIGNAESPAVAQFYVERVTDSFVVRKVHDVGLLLSGAEGYRTQWVAGAVVAAPANPAINRQEALEQRNRSVAEEWAREMEQGSNRAAI